MANLVKIKLGFELAVKATYLDDLDSIFTKANTFMTGQAEGSEWKNNSRWDSETEIGYVHLHFEIIVVDMDEAAAKLTAMLTALPTMPPTIDGEKGFSFKYCQEGLVE